MAKRAASSNRKPVLNIKRSYEELGAQFYDQLSDIQFEQMPEVSTTLDARKGSYVSREGS
jgi:hypothetical protein